MQRFSKLRPKEEKDFTDKDEIKYSDDHMKIINYEDWSVVKEKDMVVCIPYLIETNQIIIRNEYIPSFKYADGQEYHITLVGGGIEMGETPEQSLLRELQEEAGLVLRDNFKIEFEKPLFKTKGHADKYYPCILTLTENDYHEVLASGDGSKIEKMSQTVKIDTKFIKSLNASDLITEYMLNLLKDYINLK